MYLSDEARGLLDSGEVEALQALSHERLFPAPVREKIQEIFNQPREAVAVGDSVAEDFVDAVSCASLQEACVISSGHIFSRVSIGEYIEHRRSRGE